jgi:presequence protease
VIEATEELKERQAKPDSPEALASIPSLQLSDIPTTSPVIPTAVSSAAGGATLLTHDLFTSDVLYADIALPLRAVPTRLLPLVPLFCRALTEMGTEKESVVELTERIDRTTGGLSVSPLVAQRRGVEEPVAAIRLRSKAMGSKVPDMFKLATDVLLTARLDDKERFKQMVLETKAGMEAGVVGGGHSFAAGRLAAQRGVAAWVNEQMGGIEHLFYIRDLAKRVDTEWDVIKADLEALRSAVLTSAVRAACIF